VVRPVSVWATAKLMAVEGASVIIFSRRQAILDEALKTNTVLQRKSGTEVFRKDPWMFLKEIALKTVFLIGTDRIRST